MLVPWFRSRAGGFHAVPRWPFLFVKTPATITDMLESTTISDEIYNLIPNRIDRCMVVLFFKWGLTPEEIGHAFDIPPDLVVDHINKTKQAIRMALGE